MARSAKLAGIMENYYAMLKEKLAKYHADPDPKPEDRKEIDAMLQIAQAYDLDQLRWVQRQHALEIRQAEYELKVKRAAAAEKRDKERAKERREAAEREEPLDFDNSARIAAARAAHRAQWDTPENRAEVKARLAKAEAHLDPANNPNIIRHD